MIVKIDEIDGQRQFVVSLVGDAAQNPLVGIAGSLANAINIEVDLDFDQRPLQQSDKEFGAQATVKGESLTQFKINSS